MGDARRTLWLGVRRRPLDSVGDRNDHVFDRAAALGKGHSVHELAPNLAFFAGPFVAELFLSWSTWRLALSSLGMASLVASLAYFRFGRGGEFPGESPASSAFGLLVRAPSFWIMAVLFGLGVSSTIGVYAMLPL